MVFKAKYQIERTTEESFTDEMNTLNYCEALLNKLYSFLHFLPIQSRPIPAILFFFFYWKFTTK